MKFAKIQFDSRDTSAKALHGMMQRGRIVGLRDLIVIVPAQALDWLTSEKLPYTLVEMMNQDDVVQTLRNNLAHPV